MDRHSLAIFIHEIRNQCLYTEAAFSVFNQSLEQRAANGVFLAAHSVLMNAGQIAAILWPTRARSKKRGEALREVLQLPEKHPLNDRRISEIWEHGDEKLDAWVGATKGHHIIFDHIGPLEEFVEFPVAEGNIFRMYDTKTLIFYYRGDGFKLKAIAEANGDIYARADAVHRQLLPDQHTEVPQQAAPIPSAAAGDLESESASANAGDSKSKPKTAKK
jgi:hypothetical protein